MEKKLTIAGIVIALILGVFAITKDSKVVQNITNNTPLEKVGALSSPNIISPYLAVNGVREEYRRADFITSSTTLCRLDFPVGSSTPIYFGVNSGTGANVAIAYDVSTSTTAGVGSFATSTSYNWVYQRAVAVGAYDRAFLLATTSASERNADGSYKLINSSDSTTTIFLVKTGTTTYSANNAFCEAKFLSVN